MTHRDNILTIEDGILITFKDYTTSFIRTSLRSKENKGDSIPDGSYVKSDSKKGLQSHESVRSEK